MHNKLKRLKMKDINRQLNLPTSESVYDTISILMNSGTLPLTNVVFNNLEGREWCNMAELTDNEKVATQDKEKDAETIRQEKDIEARLNKKEEKDKSKDAAINIKKFYTDHEEICKSAIKYSDECKDHLNHFVLSPSRIEKEEFCNKLCDEKILVITANPIEQAVFLHWLNDFKKEKEGLPTTESYLFESYLVGPIVFIVCNIDNRSIIHIHTTNTGEEFTRVAINYTTKIFCPSYIFMLGICYGLDMGRHEIGSVFLSEKVATFRLNFRDNENGDKTIFEAKSEYNKAPEQTMIDMIQGKLDYSTIENILSDHSMPTIAQTNIGKFLSSNSLMSSKEVKKAVMEQFRPTAESPALGGEMEGGGILKSYYVQENNFQKWMIIKSICDWGEKKNALAKTKKASDLIKDSIQAFAMANTCATFKAILEVL